jgi:hypothetical protein
VTSAAEKAPRLKERAIVGDRPDRALTGPFLGHPDHRLVHVRRSEERRVRVARVIERREDRRRIVCVALVQLGERIDAGGSVGTEQVGEAAFICPAFVHRFDRGRAGRQADRQTSAGVRTALARAYGPPLDQPTMGQGGRPSRPWSSA